jgi:molybdopterin synthase catalytic subunit
MSTRRAAAFVLSPDALDEEAFVAAVDSPQAGGIVTFLGKVRAHARGQRISRLEYEAYPEMVERVFADIGREAKAKFEIHEIAIGHRTGSLSVGETSVVVAVSAAHRGAAFDACEYAIDELKQRAPIWKKEHGENGAVWIDERA